MDVAARDGRMLDMGHNPDGVLLAYIGVPRGMWSFQIMRKLTAKLSPYGGQRLSLYGGSKPGND